MRAHVAIPPWNRPLPAKRPISAARLRGPVRPHGLMPAQRRGKPGQHWAQAVLLMPPRHLGVGRLRKDRAADREVRLTDRGPFGYRREYFARTGGGCSAAMNPGPLTVADRALGSPGVIRTIAAFKEVSR